MLITYAAIMRQIPRRAPWLRRWPLAIAAAILGLALVAGSITWRAPYLGVRRSLDDVVYRIEPASPGAEAGFRLGDHLTHVDGVPIAEAIPLFGDKVAGDSLAFDLVRAGRSRTIHVTLASPPLFVRLRRLSYLAVALIFWLVGVFVLARLPVPTRQTGQTGPSTPPPASSSTSLPCHARPGAG